MLFGIKLLALSLAASGFLGLVTQMRNFARSGMNAFPRHVHEVGAPAMGAAVNKPDWTVRIIAAPPGEAPLWVRQQWVGLDLPVTRYSGQSWFLGLGVLSMPRSWLGQWLAVIKGHAELVAGYAVEALPAVGILGEKSPEAAVWWRENTPHLIAPKRYLIFHEEVCRIADI
jgi:hypothetical protein